MKSPSAYYWQFIRWLRYHRFLPQPEIKPTIKAHHRLFRGINNSEDLVNVDQRSFFHEMIKKAQYYSLLKLIQPIPNEQLNELTGNAAVIRDIIYEYLAEEDQIDRKVVLERALTNGLWQCTVDDNYEEVLLQKFLYRICEAYEQGKFTFRLTSLDSFNWFSDTRQGRNWIEITYQGKTTTNKVIPLPEF